MKLEIAELLVEAGAERDVSLSENYSPRVSFGETTAGVVCGMNKFAQCLVAVTKDADEATTRELVQMAKNLQVDACGKVCVFY